MIHDLVTQAEAMFIFKDIMKTEYFQKLRKGYYEASQKCLLNVHRNYLTLLTFINEIYEYDKQHAKHFVSRFRGSSKDWRNCEATFSEIIVYRHYIRSNYEGIIKKIHLDEPESDIIIERLDGNKAYLEVLCVMPELKFSTQGKSVVNDLGTHQQNELSSIRQKILHKVNKQKQFSAQRENYAVIELNDPRIASEFTVLSSLSRGYNINFNSETGDKTGEGYNWEASLFDDPKTAFIKAIIYFYMGDYQSRKFVFNPKFHYIKQA